MPRANHSRFNPRPGLATGATEQRERAANRTEFQSAPRPCDRGDDFAGRIQVRRPRFNPRPGLATGATYPRRSYLCDPRSFNPRPGLATGATHRERNPSPSRNVSIRAPALRPGRPMSRTARTVFGWFQSAPRPCDRGDCGLPNWPSCKSFVPHSREPANLSCVPDC